ncbi:potassium channel family protein [endosymbiont of unidentified scaly snail isolate Monju]|uniref:potassium channel family protein n=1 Tax=endosymbiont of unidentified scaly snail isolate Monju TaxID=1248727 RepID=UPI0003891E68|nr:NAD-binding protein [endosymbiont of unidentified scaly snail isolate Monju]BAN69703.1 TrkA-N domain protein [endosymbiont of unidentified scaly snail isolate Monju]
MNNIVFLIMRRMRLPLLTLVAVYAITVLGMTLIPGQDADGNVWYMDIFHAFYFVSFMSTTIGFGEIPYPFSDAQRLWVTFSIYVTVIAWLYAIGTIISLLQDKTFQRAVAERLFARKVRQMREPFYLVCGYGETGQTLVRAFTERGQHVVVLDCDEERIAMIQLQDLRDYVPALAADARHPLHLQEAGLPHPACAGVVAVTDDNLINLKIAITSKLLHPNIKVICRADSRDVEDNMASFGTDEIVDPFETFARYLVLALQMPCLYLLQRWVGGERGAALEEPVYPPAEGRWLVCGYGRFGKAMVARLAREGIEFTVVEARPDITGEPPPGYVLGRGTEARTLREAGIDEAVGLIAGTDDDANNLSIVMTARELRPDLFVILRQNQSENRDLVHAVSADMVMQPSAIIAERIRVLLATPMLSRFFSLAAHRENDWACELVARLIALLGDQVPLVRELEVDARHADALLRRLEEGEPVCLGEVLRDPWTRERSLCCMALMVERRGERILVPGDDFRLAAGDHLLLVGQESAFTRLAWNLGHDAALDYVRTGQPAPQGWLWRRLTRGSR